MMTQSMVLTDLFDKIEYPYKNENWTNVNNIILLLS